MTTSRGRIDKRQAILRGAFAVFARQGYAQACVQEIADEAGVAKPTVYNHLTDKATLFRHAVQDAAQAALQQRLAALEPLVEPGDNLRDALEGVGHELLRLYCDEHSCALRRLLYSEIICFPDILDVVTESGPHRLTQALADRLARLILVGRLRAGDPDLAAEQLLALLVGPLEARSRMGTRLLGDDELWVVTRGAVDTFLQAYAPSDRQSII
ncbi:TetR/AcrR family transcriptional regulator [Streptosporangium roseum]|uniref:Transcriptional regulator, TetR family n=1 Tax=Streptosporangium roseum (strain ATCC 12428 / DSM 43021 / JCM 3005 / KCTC 9067 / NCIMB 10171 / NRRL 2505 / NI 9100) TaxID=479432 RepID=D2AS40_STRRD|nr:TetR/AcrR family transcriptional regulator [Streptosporangium roseum]ACZ86567.1 putative transcriptional regulator, TetR family [Streptosporangium roseum DSM 43021]